MRRKLAGQGGLTLVEVLAAAVILVLLGLIVNAGMQMALSSYRAMVAQSETGLLLSTLADTLADDLRYAEVTVDGSGGLFRCGTDSYGEDTRLSVSSADGKVYVNGDRRLLPDGAYGLNGRYEVSRLDIAYSGQIFTLDLAVKEKDSTIHAETKLTVRCLNPQRTQEEAEP